MENKEKNNRRQEAGTLFSPKFVADSLGISVGYVRKLEDELDLPIKRVQRGSVEVRTYSPSDIFMFQAKRRERGQLKGLPHPVTVSVYVKKGGTAKTTITVNLAIQLQLQGLRVLVIDNDSQGDCTTMFGYDPDRTAEELVEDSIDPSRAVDGHFGNLLALPNSRMQKMELHNVVKMPFGEYGPHLIPAEESLDDVGMVLDNIIHSDLRYGLFIEKSRAGQVEHCDFSQYDVILVDNNPGITSLSRNAMLACDMMVCPIRFDRFSFRALTRLSSMLNEFYEATGKQPDIVAVPTMYIKARPRMQRNLAKLSELLPNNVSQTQLVASEDYSKSLEDNIPLSFYSKSPIIASLRELATEIHQRLRTIAGMKS
jgi:chromosome partitioning protein